MTTEDRCARSRRLSLRSLVLVPSAALLVPFAASPAEAAMPAFQHPFPCRWQRMATSYENHMAVDWNLAGDADYGKPVLAGAGGTAYKGWASGYGNYVIVKHTGTGWRSLYAHLRSTGTTYIPDSGKAVSRLTKIGEVGNTGSNTSGTHLHHEQQRWNSETRRWDRQSTVSINGKVVETGGTSHTSTNC